MTEIFKADSIEEAKALAVRKFGKDKAIKFEILEEGKKGAYTGFFCPKGLLWENTSGCHERHKTVSDRIAAKAKRSPKGYPVADASRRGDRRTGRSDLRV